MSCQWAEIHANMLRVCEFGPKVLHNICLGPGMVEMAGMAGTLTNRLGSHVIVWGKNCLLIAY